MQRRAWQAALVVAVLAVGGVVAATWLPGWSASTRDLVELVSWCVTIVSGAASPLLWAWGTHRGASTPEPASPVTNSVTGTVVGPVVQGGTFGNLTLTTTPPSPAQTRLHTGPDVGGA